MCADSWQYSDYLRAGACLSGSQAPFWLLLATALFDEVHPRHAGVKLLELLTGGLGDLRISAPVDAAPWM
jgi:hypothetical protein